VSSAAHQAQRLQAEGFGSSSLLMGLLFLVALAGVVWISMGMLARDQWPIRWLEVNGAFERVSAERIRTRVEPLANASFFTIDLGAVADAARGLDWVAEVQVSKQWPDTVQLSVHEYVPLAHWTGDRLLAAGGLAFEVPGARDFQGLPWVEGPDGTEQEVYRTWQEFNEELFAVGLEIERIRPDRRGSWYLEVLNGTRVQLGREHERARLQRLVASWPELALIRDKLPMNVDLRYANGFAARWPEPPPTALVDNRK
jgi:cell division protein FtsQ